MTLRSANVLYNLITQSQNEGIELDLLETERSSHFFNSARLHMGNAKGIIDICRTKTANKLWSGRALVPCANVLERYWVTGGNENVA